MFLYSPLEPKKIPILSAMLYNIVLFAPTPVAGCQVHPQIFLGVFLFRLLTILLISPKSNDPYLTFKKGGRIGTDLLVLTGLD